MRPDGSRTYLEALAEHWRQVALVTAVALAAAVFVYVMTAAR